MILHLQALTVRKQRGEVTRNRIISAEGICIFILASVGLIINNSKARYTMEVETLVPQNESEVSFELDENDLRELEEWRRTDSRKRRSLSLELWSRVAGNSCSSSNSEQLAVEMWVTTRQIASFMRALELHAKQRRIKKLTNTTGDWIKFCAEEEKFTNSLEVGHANLVRLGKALGLGVGRERNAYLQPPQLYSRISRFQEFHLGRSPSERIDELNLCLRELIGRFAKICETEGFKHQLPVLPCTLETPVVEALPKMKKRISAVEVPTIQVPDVKKEPESKNIVYEFGDMLPPESPIEECPGGGGLTPAGFLWEYSRRDGSTPIYEDMGVVGKSALGQEFVVLCRLKNMSGEGRARKKTVAKQTAAAMLVKSLLNKQRLAKLPACARHLSEQERLVAIRVMSEYIDFEKELERVSGEEYHRPPIYTPLVNTSGNHFRCKALGYNATGYGRTKEIARRMSAKLILDTYRTAKEEAKRRTKEEFEASRICAQNIQDIKT